MKLKLRFPALAVALAMIYLRVPTAAAQQVPATSDQTFAAIARDTAAILHSSGVKRIFILDFEDPNHEVKPFGAWLAEQFASAAENSWKPIEVIDRGRVLKELKLPDNSEAVQVDDQTARTIEQSLDAIAIKGSYSRAEDGLGVTLGTLRFSKPAAISPGKLAITDVMKAHLSGPLEAIVPKDGIFESDHGGIGTPRCEYCPNLQFTPQAVQHHIQGVVILSAVITADGHASKVSILKGIGSGLDEAAADIVRHWRFRPAVNIDGLPVTVRVPVEVVFRLKN